MTSKRMMNNMSDSKILKFNVYSTIINNSQVVYNKKGEPMRNIVKLDVNSILANIYNFKAANPNATIVLNAMTGNFDMLAKIARQIGITRNLVMQEVKNDDGKVFHNLCCELPKELPPLEHITLNKYRVFDDTEI